MVDKIDETTGKEFNYFGITDRIDRIKSYNGLWMRIEGDQVSQGDLVTDRFINDKDCSSISLSAKTSIVGSGNYVYPGEEVNLIIEQLPENTNIPKLVFESSDKSLASVNTKGKVLVNPQASGSFTITATTAPGNTNSDPFGVTNSIVFNIINSNTEIYTVSVKSGENGSAEIVNESNFIRAISGTEIVIKATPIAGYSFSKWSDDNTSERRTIVVSSNINLTAEFIKNE